MLVHLSGTQAALLVGSGVTFIGYPFREAGAAAVRKRFNLNDISGFTVAVVEQWRGVLAHHALDTPTAWASKDYSLRAALDVALELSVQNLAVAIAAVDACLTEFSDNWIEFLLVAPGAIDRYRPTPAELASLLLLLRACRD